MRSVNSEAERVFNSLFTYAREKRHQNVNDFTEIVGGFYRQMLREYEAGVSRNGSVKKILAVMRSYVDTDPRYQMRIDEVLR